MVVPDVILGPLCKQVVQQASKSWSAHRTMQQTADNQLVDQVQVGLRDRVMKRRFERQIDDIADHVLQRLEPFVQHEFGLAESEIAPVVAEVARVLAAADLSDDRLFASNADALTLTRDLRLRMTAPVALDEREQALFDVLLVECVESYVRIAIQLQAFLPRASQEVLARLSDLGGSVGRIFERLPARSLHAPAGTDFDAHFADEYRTYIGEALDELELFGVDIRNYTPRTRLSVAYLSLAVSDDDEQDSARRRRPHPAGPADRDAAAVFDDASSGGGQAEGRDIVSRRVESALAAHRRLLIRGEAGSGKSTLLRYLAVTAARRSFSGELAEWNDFTPFFIKLRSYGGGRLPNPEEFLNEVAGPIAGHKPEVWVERVLRDKRALLLVDGVDELPRHSRTKVRTWLQGLLLAYPSLHVVVTSRPGAATDTWLAQEGFKSASLDRMKPEDIRVFVRQWHEAIVASGTELPAYVDNLARYEVSLLSRLRSSAHLRALATNPLLCAMLCALNLEHRKQLPRNRMGVYNAALQLLVHRRDASREIPSFQSVDIDAADKLTLLRDLAWRLTIYSRSEASRDDAVDWVRRRMSTMPQIREEPESVFEHLLHRSGVIQEPVSGRIDFVHRTFQEYLAAKEAAEQDHLDLVIDKAHTDLWRETAIMTAGHANEPLRIKLIAGLMERTRGRGRSDGRRHSRRLKLIIVSCLETMDVVPPKVAPIIDELLDQLVPPAGASEVRSLAFVGTPVLQRAPQNLDGLSDASAAATVDVVGLIGGPEALDVLTRYSQDPRDRVVTALLRAWDSFPSREYAERVLATSPLSTSSRVVQLQGATHFPSLPLLQNLTALSVENIPSIAGLAPVLPKLQDLHLLSPREDDGLGLDISSLADAVALETLIVMRISEGWDVLQGLSRLSHLSINCRPRDRHLDYLRGLRLRWLNLNDAEFVLDFSPLLDMPVQIMQLSGLRHLRDLRALSAGQDLQHLRLSNSHLPNGLQGADALALVSLSLWNCQGVPTLDGLQGARLGHLTLHSTDVVDLSALREVDRLWGVHVSAAAVTDFEPLLHIAQLERVYITDGVLPKALADALASKGVTVSMRNAL